MSNFFSSIEAINFQAASPLAKDLIALFQTGIDLRERIKQDPKIVKSEIIKQVYQHTVDHIAPKLNQIIKTHIGASITECHISKQLDIGYAICMHFGESSGFAAADIIRRYSGISKDMGVEYMLQHLKIKPTTAEDMKRAATSLDPASGKVSHWKIGKLDINFSLQFDPHFAFLIKETCHVKLDYLTAPEITAIVLHELGHLITALEHSADYYFRMEAYKKLVVTFQKEAPRSEQKKYVLDGLKTVLNEKVELKETDGVFSVLLSSLLILLITILGSCVLPIIAACHWLANMQTELELILRDAQNGKLSDFGATSKNLKYCEQLADEYVSRHGLSGDLASSLQKVNKTATLIGITALATNSSMIYYLAKLPWFIQTLAIGDPNGGFGLYDRSKKRTEQLLSNTLKAFKASDLPPEVLEVFIKDYNQTKLIFDNPTRGEKFTEAITIIRQVVHYLVSPTSWVQLFSSGRFTSEYDKLFAKIEHLTGNKLLYRAAKLDLLLEQNKNKKG